MKRLIPLIAVLVVLMACTTIPATSVPTAEPPTVPPAATLATPSAPCQLIAISDSTIYQRPSAAAEVFGTLAAGERVTPAVQTADGFYGFDPGVAQAGNVGVFRNRWILKTATVSLEGDCASLPTVVGPIANICYAMSMGDTPVYSSSDTGAAVLASMHSGDYVMALGTSSGWVKVDLNVGTLSVNSIGWVQEENIGYSGSCEGG